MAGGVAFVPAVPGLAPRGFYVGERRLGRNPVRPGICFIKAP